MYRLRERGHIYILVAVLPWEQMCHALGHTSGAAMTTLAAPLQLKLHVHLVCCMLSHGDCRQDHLSQFKCPLLFFTRCSNWQNG